MQEEAAEATNQARLFLEQAGEEEEKEEKEEKRGSLVPLHIPRVAALVVDSCRGMFALLVFLVMIFHALCSSFQASWSVCSRRTVVYASSTLAAACPRLVLLFFHLALCSFLLLLGPWCSASWLLYTRRTIAHFIGSGMCKACVAGLEISRCVPLRVWQARMLGILAGMNQKDRFAFYTVVHTPVVCNDMALVTGCRKLWILRSCSPFSRSSTSLSYRRGSSP